jgi:hypothetical protein
VTIHLLQAFEKNTFKQISIIMSEKDYKSFLTSGSITEAEPYNMSDTSHYCTGPMLGLRSGMVEPTVETNKQGAYTGIVKLKLTYTFGLEPGSVSYGTIRNECPFLILVSKPNNIFAYIKQVLHCLVLVERQSKCCCDFCTPRPCIMLHTLLHRCSVVYSSVLLFITILHSVQLNTECATADDSDCAHIDHGST